LASAPLSATVSALDQTRRWLCPDQDCAERGALGDSPHFEKGLPLVRVPDRAQPLSSTGGTRAPWIQAVAGRFLQPTAEERIGRLIEHGEVLRAIDLGCGEYSPLTRFRPEVWTVGVDASAESLARARSKEILDDFLLADVTDAGFFDQCRALGPFDLVAAVDLIEHLPKRLGFDLLEGCEKLTSKFVVVQTPNGFVEQGPEYGNTFQSHRSGWFQHDLSGLGYKVYGSTGTRIMRGYGANLRVQSPLASAVDALLTTALGASTHPRFAFNLIAIKDVRGVPAHVGGAVNGPMGDERQHP